MFLITQHCFAVYRKPIFQKLLSGKAGMKGRLLFGRNPSHDNVKTYESLAEIPPCNDVALEQYVYVQNYWFFKRILWQCGLLREVSRPEIKAVIFEGNPYHLSTWVAMACLRLFTKKRILLWTHGIKKKPTHLKALINRCFWGLDHGLKKTKKKL